ncbi:phenylalanyl-tRNA synthetase beta subunit [Kushneria avicenniae]|uniref:Phenylalanine--tRNA ligase beta subunit n=1 Tax=Kushneria avicenniae TaxID=402385 RepID=A0A1I1FJL0_9GAMM|nr:phenylalanine--tRNA ligase subunit beta [Kushneria avicenniae]SFB97240.1 phenylalanyl-tRNA synthetase beta subunit [Kushneria avicenniae]
MKVSEQWLRQWVDAAQDVQAIADQITMAGLEVDAIEPVSASFSGVVIARVEEASQHPDADRLRVCQLDDGSGHLQQVVCGAPNVAAGQKVALARPGAILPSDFAIKEARLRGVASHGMICAESELGLAEEKSPGIWVLPDNAIVGEDLRQWLGLDDHSIDVDLTPNRGDCLSVMGLARELGVLNRLEVKAPEILPVTAQIDDRFEVRLDNGEACPRYSARVVRDVDVSTPSPLWLTEYLRRCGLRSIDIVVDITNYVMLELGQPMHAFDLDQLQGHIEIRNARANETLTLLDGQDVELQEDTLLIADGHGPLAIAGVMGGERSGVNADTRHVLLESAFFAPIAVAGKARQYGLHTDASHRFERGVDSTLQVRALERATGLLIELAGGRPGPVIEKTDQQALPEVCQITLSAERVSRILGMTLEDGEISDILSRLGMTLTPQGQGHWDVSVPAWRFDIRLEEDLVEELARIHGYNRLPVRYPQAELSPQREDDTKVSLDVIREHLVAGGYQEAITYSFVSDEIQKAFAPDAVTPTLANPISSDMSVMRSSLWAGLSRALLHNLNRQQQRVRLFETGLVFSGDIDTLTQVPMLGGMICGTRDPEGWASRRESVDFFDIKGDVEHLLALGGAENEWRFEPGEHVALHPGQCARILRGDRGVGWVGALHPAVRERFGIKPDVYVFELELSALQQGRLAAFTPLSRYPEVRRDLALLVDEQLPVQSLLDAVHEQAGEALTDLRLFDVYQGAGVEEGRKSVALGLTWQHHSRTLTDLEIHQAIDNIVAVSSERFGALLRN